jgi:hypothetical protein
MGDTDTGNSFFWTGLGGLPIVSPWGSARYVAAQAFLGAELARQYADGGRERGADTVQRVQAYRRVRLLCCCSCLLVRLAC